MTASQLKDLYARKASAMTRRPAFARGTGQARVVLTDGLACEVEHTDRTLRVDLPLEEGGTASGPHPGQLMRASVGACLAMGYRLWAARLDVALDHVYLEIGCDYDARGQMGVATDVAIGWQRLVIEVTVTSAAAETDVRRVVETADRLSPMLANLSPSLARVHKLTIVAPAAASRSGGE